MKKTLFVLHLGLLTLMMSFPAFGKDSKEILKDVYGLYKRGAYVQAIDKLKKVRGNRATRATANYWRGLCQSRLQRYDLAVRHFEVAKRLGSTAPDLHFELGQAYYASQSLRKARNSFRLSSKKGYKKAASLYYVGYSSQVLEDYDRALATYKKIQGLPNDPENVKQPSLFQIAEIKNIRAETIKDEKRRKEVLKSKVIPSYETAEKFDEETPTAKEAESRIRAIKLKYFPKSKRPWKLKVSFDLDYDTNVVSQADEARIVLSQTDSLVLKPGLNGSYEFRFGDFSTTAHLGVVYNRHSRQDVAKVHQNDQITFDPALRSFYQYRMFGDPARTILDFEYNYLLRDKNQDHSLLWYQSHYKIVLGQRVKLLPVGSSTLKISWKRQTSENIAYSNRTPGFNLNQAVSLGSVGLWTLGGGADFQTSKEAVNSLWTWKLNTSVTLRELIWKVTVRPAFNYSIINTLLQKSARGIEKSINPSLSLSRDWLDQRSLATSLTYSYTQKLSLDTVNYAYSKHVITTGVSWKF